MLPQASSTGWKLDVFENGMRSGIVVQFAESVIDDIGVISADDRVSQTVELLRKLVVSERVFVVPRGKSDFFSHHSAVIQCHGYSIGDSRGVTGRELGVFEYFECAIPGGRVPDPATAPAQTVGL